MAAINAESRFGNSDSICVWRAGSSDLILGAEAETGIDGDRM